MFLVETVGEIMCVTILCGLQLFLDIFPQGENIPWRGAVGFKCLSIKSSFNLQQAMNVNDEGGCTYTRQSVPCSGQFNTQSPVCLPMYAQYTVPKHDIHIGSGTMHQYKQEYAVNMICYV